MYSFYISIKLLIDWVSTHQDESECSTLLPKNLLVKMSIN